MIETTEQDHSLDALISTSKTNLALWEDFISRTNKLNTSIKSTLQCSRSFIEALQKLADLASVSTYGVRDIGATLTRFCIRQKIVESRIKTLNSRLNDNLACPIQDRLEDWKRANNLLERERNREWRRAKSELQKVMSERDRLRKKTKKKNVSRSFAAEQFLELEIAEQNYEEKRSELENVERASLRKILLEDRKRFIDLVEFLAPLLDSQLAIFNEATNLQELVQTLFNLSTASRSLPSETEAFISQCTLKSASGSPGIFNRRSSRLSFNSRCSSSSSLTSNVSIGDKNEPASGEHAAPDSASSSQDSGFTSHDATNAALTAMHRELSDFSQHKLFHRSYDGEAPDRVSLFDDNETPSPRVMPAPVPPRRDSLIHHSQSDIQSSTVVDETDGSMEGTLDGDESDTSTSSYSSPSLGGSEIKSFNASELSELERHKSSYTDLHSSRSVNPIGQDTRRHTVNSEIEENVRSEDTFKPSTNRKRTSSQDSIRAPLYPNQAIPGPIYANLNILQMASRKMYGDVSSSGTDSPDTGLVQTSERQSRTRVRTNFDEAACGSSANPVTSSIEERSHDSCLSRCQSQSNPHISPGLSILRSISQTATQKFSSALPTFFHSNVNSTTTQNTNDSSSSSISKKKEDADDDDSGGRLSPVYPPNTSTFQRRRSHSANRCVETSLESEGSGVSSFLTSKRLSGVGLGDDSPSTLEALAGKRSTLNDNRPKIPPKPRGLKSGEGDSNNSYASLTKTDSTTCKNTASIKPNASWSSTGNPLDISPGTINPTTVDYLRSFSYSSNSPQNDALAHAIRQSVLSQRKISTNTSSTFNKKN